MVRIGTVLISNSLSEVDQTGEVDPTRCAEVDLTRSAEVDLTRRGEVDPTGVIEIDPTREGVGVETRSGELNLNRTASGDGDKGECSGEARPSDSANVQSNKDKFISPECMLRVSGNSRTPHCAALRLLTGSNTSIGGVQASLTSIGVVGDTLKTAGPY